MGNTTIQRVDKKENRPLMAQKDILFFYKRICKQQDQGPVKYEKDEE